jgi:hypothetical protein
MDNIDLNVLKSMWLKYKSDEETAKALRLEIETAILSDFPTDKTEGSITNADFGITVIYKLTRTVDSEAVQNAWNDLSANAQKAFKVKFEVDLKQYRAVQDLDHSAFAEVSKFVTSKPAKPSIAIKG